MTGRMVLFLAPIVLWLIWLLLPLARGRSIKRLRFTMSLSLLTLLYFLAVAGTGIFWVAAQELPVFDWHYLPAYILTSLTLTHVAVHWRQITSFLRRGAPGALLEPEGLRFRGGVRKVGSVLLFAFVGGAIYFLGLSQGSVQVNYASGAGLANTLPRTGNMDGVVVPPTILNANGRQLTLAQFYHEGSAYPARTRLPGLTLESRPPVYKDYPGFSVSLPIVPVADTMQVFSAYGAWRDGLAATEGADLDLEQLAALLNAAQGVSKTIQGFDLRTSPSAGALYPVNLYLVVGALPGLEPGIYYHHPKEGTLILVRADAAAGASIFDASANPGVWEGAGAAVVLTTTFARTAFKYRERAYRYVCMDAGHVAYNLATAGSSLGWRMPMIARFDDRAVDNVLGLDPGVESAMLIMPIARTGTAAEEPKFVSVAPLGEPTSFVELMQGGTSLRRAGARGDYAARARNLPVAGANDIPLPAPATGDGVFASAQRRRSVRNYSTTPLTLEDLSSLFLAAAGERQEGPAVEPFLAETAPLGLYAVVNDVTGLTPGTYEYLPGAHALRLKREGDFSEETRDACLAQDFCRTADVVFVKTVRWDELVVPDGDRGYRYASLRAGVLGGGLYLQGTALGIGVCGVGAFTDPDIAGLFDLDPDREVPLYVTAVGR